MNYIKVRSLDTNKIGVLEDCEEDLRRDDLVVVDSEEKGEDIVRVLGPSKEDASSGLRLKYIRKATKRDLQRMKKNEKESRRAYDVCKEKIKEHGLEMHLLKAYVPLNARKIFFYYTAEERVDFRRLVRDLAKIFRKRIEMRQVGVRDAVQILGWIGMCGEIPCCLRFMENFESISLKDIEDQNLPLSPSKFTGPCGRLVCCMAFERENYLVKNLLPPKETEICIEGKVGKVLEVDPIRNLMTVEFEDRKREIPLDELLPRGYERALRFCKSCQGCVCRNGEVSEEYETAFSN